LDPVCDAGGFTPTEFFGGMMSVYFMTNGPRNSDERNLVLGSLLVELLRAPEMLPPALMNAAHLVLCHSMMGRAAVAQRVLDHGILEVTISNLKQASPQEWVSTSHYNRAGFVGGAFIALKDVVESAQAGGVDLTSQLLATGLIDMCVDALEAAVVVEADASPIVITYGVLPLLMNLDGEHIDEVYSKIRAVAPALRHVIDHDIVFAEAFGFNSAVYATCIVAIVWGKDEDEAFKLRGEDLDGLITFSTELLTPRSFGSIWTLSKNHCKGLLNVSISDRGKRLLLETSGFIPHLISGLLLDEDHPRKDTDQEVKAAVQRDFAECIQQISLYEPGCAALRAEHAVVEALTALKNDAWTEEAKLCAEGALMVLAPQDEAHHDIDEQHVMVSCESRRAHSPLLAI
jgi:hypothetical protein